MSFFRAFSAKSSSLVSCTEDTLCDELNEIERRRARAHCPEPPAPDLRGETFNERAARLKLTALCLSGGGIRSAAYCLGVLQALASRKLLNEFDYLSTVSGGGFIGGWLQMLLRTDGNVDDVQTELKTAGAKPVQGLRAYTNYLTPSTGPFSADTWAGIVLYIRNLLLNWLIFLPLFLLLAMAPILYRTLLRALCDNGSVNAWLLAVAAIALVVAAWQGGTLLPSHRTHPVIGFARPRGIGLRVMVPALIWAWLVPFCIEFAMAKRPNADAAWRGHVLYIVPLAYVAAMTLGYCIAWAQYGVGARKLFATNVWRWIAATLFAALLMWTGLYLVLAHGTLYYWAGAHLLDAKHRLMVDTETTLTVLFPFWLVATHLLQTTFYVGFRKEAVLADLDREWLARLSGELLRWGVAWTGLALCCLVLTRGAGLVDADWKLETSIGGTTLLGAFTAWLGARASAGIEAIAANPGRYMTILLNCLCLLFAAGLLAAAGGLLHYGLGKIQTDLIQPHMVTPVPWWSIVATQLGLALLLFALILCFGRVNVNRFSMHAVYRNRLTRAFLGSARTSRDPDPFTGFDPRDNWRLIRFKRPPNRQRLFPVVNMTLNMTASSNSAWAERQAASFTATPLACGSATLRSPNQKADNPPVGAFVPTEHYAGQDSPGDLAGTDRGIRLGTVLTISGAAVSPNWGYHSSRLTAFLMTLFNVRLGAWLPNPAIATDRELSLSQPSNSVRALIDELIGSTTDTTQAIYLSDGGHFENLGVYEMLRRRCTRIVMIDAGQDAGCTMYDLGNAIRKAAIDLGASVTMANMRIYPRKTIETDKDAARDALGFAMGEITYEEGTKGELIYVKPSFLQAIPEDVRAYGEQDDQFPHDSTLQQWFTESQFESYRALGQWQMRQIVDGMRRGNATLDELFAAATRCAKPPSSPRQRPVLDPVRLRRIRP